MQEHRIAHRVEAGTVPRSSLKLRPLILLGLVCDHGAVDDIGESVFEDPQCFHASVAVGFSACQKLAGWRVHPCLGHCDAVQGGVEWSVTCARQTMSLLIG